MTHRTPPTPKLPLTKRTVIEAQTKSDDHSSLLTHRAGLDFQREVKKKKRAMEKEIVGKVVTAGVIHVIAIIAGRSFPSAETPHAQ